MIYRIELAESENFEIIRADSDYKMYQEADEIEGGYLNIFELSEDYEIIRQVY